MNKRSSLMKAVRAHSFGSPDVLIYEEVPTPLAGPGQIRIRVEAAAVNYADIMRRSNTAYPFPTSLPYMPGSEVAGTVDQLGEGVAGPAVGTPVFALVGRDGSSGYAQFAVAEATQVIPIPPGLSVEQACALVVAGASAMLILRDVAGLREGQSVLIPGAGGGVGSYAIQIAKLLGAKLVIGAASSPAKREAAQAYGADAVVDYTQPNWPEHVYKITEGAGVDVVLESSGSALFAQSLSCLAPFGRMVVYGMASRQPLSFDDDNPQLQLMHSARLLAWLHHSSYRCQ
jgi:NADPH:quinone reductase